MPFGLTNAPATQQRFIEAVLNGLIWQCCFAYIDDILCYSPTFENHLQDLKEIFIRFQENRLKIQPPKCKFCHLTFDILGFVATRDGLKPSEKKVKAMKEYPQPRTVKEAQSFLGIVSWLWRFIPRCATLTTNIRKCISDSPKKFNLSDQAIKEVEILKEIITSDTCLAHPHLNEQFYIHVDTSKVGMGAILTQTDDQGHHQIVEYASKAMSQTQRKASNSTREAMGILWSLEHFRYYVHGKNPIVFCNCKCLSDILRSDSAPGTAALRNWVAQVLHFQPKVIHKPGTMIIKLRLLVTETSRNRKKKENRGKIDSHQARLLQRKESRWNIYYDVSIKNPHPNSLISINRVFSHK